MDLRRKGTILDGIRSMVLYNFEYLLFPDRRPKHNEVKDISNKEGTKLAWPADVWDNFWVDEVMVKKCRAEMAKYTQSGRDQVLLKQMRRQYREFRAARYCGDRTIHEGD